MNFKDFLMELKEFFKKDKDFKWYMIFAVATLFTVIIIPILAALCENSFNNSFLCIYKEYIVRRIPALLISMLYLPCMIIFLFYRPFMRRKEKVEKIVNELAR